MEKEPTLEQQYKLRELYPVYYMHLGALASTALAPENEWREVYKERIEEVKQAILDNGGEI